MLKKGSKLFLIAVLILAVAFTFSACDMGNSVPRMVTVTFEADHNSSWVFEEIRINGVNYGDDLPITTDLETGTYHVSWKNTIFGYTNSDSIEVRENGQTFILAPGEIYER